MLYNIIIYVLVRLCKKEIYVSCRKKWEGALNNYMSYISDYYQKNKEKIIARERLRYKEKKDSIRSKAKKFYEENRDKILDQQKEYVSKNKESCYAANKRWRQKNSQIVKQYERDYFEANKEKINKRSKLYIEKRKATDPLFAFKSRLRASVRGAFKRIAQNKPANTETLLGVKWEEAKAHFEKLFKPGMTWQNIGEWEIDHIRPVMTFRLDELHLINHISNLQPLWRAEHRAKSNQDLKLIQTQRLQKEDIQT